MKTNLHRTIVPTLTFATLLGSLAVAGAADGASGVNQLTSQEKKEGWQLLFDGQSMNQWRNYKKDSAGDGWKILDNALVRAGNGAGDIITIDQYGAFELVLDYRISKGGNSGLMFHVTEEADTPWMTGPEIQIQDNVDGHDPQKSGWLYQLYHADTDATKPAGEWNTVRLKVTPEKSILWMNGTKYYEFVKGSSDWDQRVAKSKFSSIPLFGKPTRGHIALQDHGNEVAFRNIKIRSLEE